MKQYICDHCGKAEIAEKKMWYDDYTINCFWVKLLPKGWTKLGKEHLCPKCSEIYCKLKEEIGNE